ncbi:MAG: hypothetical protein RLZZ535_2885 [Cyanobacteriota bacterium]
MSRVFHQTLSANQCDLIVSHFALYTLPLLNQFQNLPLVIHFHGSWVSELDELTLLDIKVTLK